MRRRRVSFVVFVATFTLIALAARAQSYGPKAQVLIISAAEFQSMSAFDGYIDSDGYLYYSGDYLFMAPLSLPEGAVIEKFCLFANDSDSAPFKMVDTFLAAVKLVPGGQSPEAVGLGVGASSSSDIGYGYYCSDPIHYTLRGKTDVDEDGILDFVAYYVRADVSEATPNSLGLGGVQITWSRHVSDPPLTPTFADVPANDPAFSEIEALVASGITAGCGIGNYCPGATLTRRQMAVFLAKAFGLHWAEGAP